MSFENHNDLIFDIGMNHGADAAFYARKGFRVISIEANPASAELANDRYTDLIKTGQIRIINYAISDQEGAIKLYVCNEESGKSTTNKDIMKHLVHVGFSFNEIKVPCLRIDEIFAEYGIPYYMKIDIEGYDLLLLEQILKTGVQPNFISVELDVRQSSRMVGLLETLGYREFQLVSQKSVPNQKEPNPVREGNAIMPSFSLGNSGLFGNDLPSQWLSSAELRRQVSRLRRDDIGNRILMKIARNLGIETSMAKLSSYLFPRAYDWYDVHAR